VVGKDWTGIQNWSSFEFIDEVLRAANLPASSYETAGSLFGGKRIFVLANLGTWYVKRGNLFNRTQDTHKSYLLSTMAHDGTMAWNGLFTDVRVVCNNTNQFALNSADNLWKVKHTLKADERIQLAASLAAGHIVYQQRMREELEELDTQRFNARQARAWAATVMADMAELVGCERYEQVIDAMPRVERQRNVPTPQDIVAEQSGQIQDLFLHGKGNNGATKYDGLNGLTEWLDHQRDRYKRAKDTNTWQQKRFVDTFSGENARLRNRGLNLLKRW
jgi:phage/plasmid-like protein (TIGR03299 family)